MADASASKLYESSPPARTLVMLVMSPPIGLTVGPSNRFYSREYVTASGPNVLRRGSKIAQGPSRIGDRSADPGHGTGEVIRRVIRISALDVTLWNGCVR
ncbi:unnamed protein product [Penicillium roqueforti FM164]|uniref:Genomic scaffold, ProqFM164S03 n=2 Tax=Penicillium TaxID=5073 RepID=W6QGH0_PENRF|nr:unnamed protein product [Penicillium roqueforti FM164]